MFFDVEIAFFPLFQLVGGLWGTSWWRREVLGVGEVEGGRICTCGGQGHVPGVASGERNSFLSSYRAVEVLGVGEVEDGWICARGGQGRVLGVASVG